MKRIFFLAFTALIASVAFADEVTTWATAVSKQPNTGRAIVYRYAKDFRGGFVKSAFPARIILVWRYTSDNGMPSPNERQAMDRMEDLLEPLVQKSGISVLAIVSTGEDLREWTFYAKSEDAFLAKLNERLTGQPRFPIEVHAGPDLKWSTYERFRGEVRE